MSISRLEIVGFLFPVQSTAEKCYQIENIQLSFHWKVMLRRPDTWQLMPPRLDIEAVPPHCDKICLLQLFASNLTRDMLKTSFVLSSKKKKKRQKRKENKKEEDIKKKSLQILLF